MTKKQITTSGICLFSISFLSVSSHAQMVQQWNFDDPAGTLASAATTEVAGGPTFDSDIGSTETTGGGALRIRRGIGENSQGQAFLDTSSPQHLQIDLTIAGWNFEGTASEVFRVGFTNGTGTLQTADFELERTGDNEISMRTVAFGGGDFGSMEVIPGLGNVREEPVSVRLQYDGINHQYNTQYDIGDGWTPLLVDGSATNNTSPDRNAGALRLYAINAFATEETEYFDVDSVTLTAIPEPSTYAAIFGGLALLGAFAYRRRVRK